MHLECINSYGSGFHLVAFTCFLLSSVYTFESLDTVEQCILSADLEVSVGCSIR
jgi:hypothetical protein